MWGTLPILKNGSLNTTTERFALLVTEYLWICSTTKLLKIRAMRYTEKNI